MTNHTTLTRRKFLTNPKGIEQPYMVGGYEIIGVEQPYIWVNGRKLFGVKERAGLGNEWIWGFDMGDRFIGFSEIARAEYMQNLKGC